MLKLSLCPIKHGKAVPKRKMWITEQVKGSKRVKAEVAIKTTSPENENQPEGVSQEAYELMIKGKHINWVIDASYWLSFNNMLFGRFM